MGFIGGKRSSSSLGAYAGDKIARAVVRRVARKIGGGKQTAAADAANVISFQNDQKQMFKARRLTRRGRKALSSKKRFTSRVIKASMTMVGLQRLVSTSTHAIASSINAQGINANFVLGGVSGDTNCRDLDAIMQYFTLTAGTSVQKIYIESMSMDWTIVNRGAGPLCLDLYEWVAKKDLDTSVGGNINALFAGGLLPTNNAVVSTTPAAISTGVGFFESTFFTTYLKCTRMTRSVVSVGAEVSGRMSVPRKFTISSDNIQPNMLLRKGLTRGVFVVQYGLPSVANVIGDATASNCVFFKSFGARCEIFDDEASALITGII